MPTFGGNLQTYKQRFLSGIEKRFLATSSPAYPDVQIIALLREAEVDLIDRLKLDQGVSTAISFSADDFDYTIPADILGQAIKQVWYTLDSDANETEVPIGFLPYETAIGHYQINRTSPVTGTPVGWCLNPSDPTEFFLLPVPDEPGTLRVLYDAYSNPLRRIWHPTTVSAITVTITAGSAAGAFSSAPPTGYCAVGDEIGIIPTTQKDGSTQSGLPPSDWYRILTLVGANFTLSEIHPEGATAAEFITAQVSVVERKMPGKLGWAIPDQAMAQVLIHKDPPRAAALLTTVEQRIARFGRDDENREMISRPVANTHWFGA